MVWLLLLGACLAALSAHADAMLVFRWSIHNDPYQARLWAAGVVVSPCLAFLATLLFGVNLLPLKLHEQFSSTIEISLAVFIAATVALTLLRRRIFSRPNSHHLYLCLSIVAATLIGTATGHWLIAEWDGG